MRSYHRAFRGQIRGRPGWAVTGGTFNLIGLHSALRCKGRHALAKTTGQSQTKILRL